MKRKVLQTLLCGKIEMELWRFKNRMLNQEPEDIFASAYEIDAKICIYELLLDMSKELPSEVLQALITLPDTLDYLYFMWMKTEDSHMEELQQCMKDNLPGYGGRTVAIGSNGKEKWIA